ncbi:hypothetical protein [Natrinema limicola]|uniref:DUF8119 domain-containing protein n=1 Tax=Natrinema limicola JCM 13563 TaxID=1230457 RepID=M0CQ82_9EURY|nr:hypothetical protein [Natrinema limicola]ELZ25411.1 hypothetical protein C476_03207 [Natrinema limicola JCM 13563]
MSNDPPRSSRPDRARPTFSAVTSGTLRVLGDVLVISLWVLFLTVLFLELGWPRWAFYGALLLGVGVYVSITSGWS